MGFIIVDKNTGDIIKNKIYKTESSAKSVITKSKSLQKFAWVVIPMPRADVLKTVANGGWYSTVVYMGKLPPAPKRYDEWGNE